METAHSEREYDAIKKRVRIILGAFAVGLILSGFTAMPLLWELEILNGAIGEGTFMEDTFAPMAQWISLIHRGLIAVAQDYPFMYYGTDWVFFAHIVIAVSFIGPLRDPVRNIWVLEYAMIACVLVLPMVFIFGPVRGLPFFWMLIDCSFGVVGFVPLAISRRYIKQMERLTA